MSGSKSRRVEALIQFCEERGIKIDEGIQVEVVQVVDESERDRVTGEEQIAVYSKDAYIECGTRVACIPKTSILSIRNSIFSDLWKDDTAIYGTDGLCALALALYGEVLTGARSPWFGYLSSLPEKTNIALLWDDSLEDDKEALIWIKGTMAERERFEGAYDEAQGVLVSDVISNYYALTAASALANAGFGDRSSEEEFKHAYALASSRAFIVDNHHGLSMVPIADAFNHSLQNHVHLEAFHDVCPLCGSEDECVHDDEDEDNDARVVEENAAPGVIEHEHSGSRMVDHGSQENTDCCDMIANAAIPPHTEVFNIYNDRLTNAQLLAHYGFILDSNENDVISWELRSLCLEVPSLISRLRFESNEEGDICRSEHSKFEGNEQTFGDGRGADGVGRGEVVSEVFGGAADMDPSIKETANFGRLEVRENDLNGTTQAFLDHLLEVVAAWPHSGGIWKTSILVYDPTDGAGGREPEIHAISPSDASFDGVNRAEPQLKSNPAFGLSDSSGNEAANVKMHSDVSEKGLGSGPPERMNVDMSEVDVAIGRNNNSEFDAKTMKATGQTTEETSTSHSRTRSGLNANATHASDLKPEGSHNECAFLLNDEAKMTHHLWLFCALVVLQFWSEREQNGRGSTIGEPRGLFLSSVVNPSANDIRAVEGLPEIETNRQPNIPLKEEVELLERVARLQMRAETIFGAQEDRDDEDEDGSLVSNVCFLGEDDTRNPRANANFDLRNERLELEGASSNIDTFEGVANQGAAYPGDKILVHNDTLLPDSPSHTDFGVEIGGLGQEQFPIGGVPIVGIQSKSMSAPPGDVSNMVFESLASASDYTAASNAACPPIRHRHQPSVLRDVDAAEPSVGDSDRFSVDAPGIMPGDARSSSYVVDQTEDASTFAQTVEDSREERHMRGACRRNDGDEVRLGSIHSEHGSLSTPQSIPYSINNAGGGTLGHIGPNFESRAVKRRRIMPEDSATSGSGMSSVIQGRLNSADLKTKLNPDEGAVPTSGSRDPEGSRPDLRHPRNPQRYKAAKSSSKSDSDAFDVPLRGPPSQQVEASRSKSICLTAPSSDALAGPRTSEPTAEGDIPGNEIRSKLARSLSVVEFTACMQHVVSFLVNARVRRMRGGVEADARDVGSMMDAIPNGHKNSKMAAALALAERSVLDSWRASWKDLRESL